MLKQEFEDRIGRKVTDQEFVEANAMYMTAGDEIDKDVFCKEWKKIGDSPLVKGLFDTAYRMNLAHQECLSIISDAADAMLRISDMEGITCPVCEALEEKAWWLVGKPEVIKRKAKMLMTFNQDEIDYIINHLK